KGTAYLTARRRVLLLAVGLLWLGWAVVLLWNWTVWSAVAHIILLALISLILTEITLLGIQKIPFTCSYQPGKSNFHLSFWAWAGLAFALFMKGIEFETQALQDARTYTLTVIVLS